MNTKRRGAATGATRIGRFEHYTCAVLSFVATVVVAALCYPLLVALTRPLGAFSTTVLLFGVVTVMACTWLALELVWEWRAGRLEPRRG